MPGINNTGLHFPRMNLRLLSGFEFDIPYESFNSLIALFFGMRHSSPLNKLSNSISFISLSSTYSAKRVLFIRASSSSLELI